MRPTQLMLADQFAQRPAAGEKDDATVVTDLATVRQWISDRTIFQHLFRYRTAVGVTYRLETLARPLSLAVLLRLFSRGTCCITDQQGNEVTVSLSYLLHLAGEWVRDMRQQKPFLEQTERELSELLLPEQGPQTVSLNLAQRPVYLRTDLTFGLQSGGSVGHIAGVLNHLDAFGGKPIFVTTDSIPTVRDEIEQFYILPEPRFREFPDLRYLAFSATFYRRALELLRRQPLSLIYQRYSLNNYAGLQLARTLRLPFVLEYNGSEVWMQRHWGSGLAHEAVAEQVELANLQGAHLVVVVSQPMKEELIARKIDAAKILVNPNGVDPDRYSPEIDGTGVRDRYGLTGKRVIGFIGTFGKWHGAEVLAEAFGRLLQENPGCREHIRLLMIGDGPTMPQVKATLDRYGVASYTVLTGLVPQLQGPAHLAACDILASPHVANPDGTPFFGSPTKLFEYMAMGKGIVASDLDQIGEVLAHNQTAWMVTPGAPDALKEGLKTLVDDPGLAHRLGTAARAEAVAKYTWRNHTQRIIEALQTQLA